MNQPGTQIDCCCLVLYCTGSIESYFENHHCMKAWLGPTWLIHSLVELEDRSDASDSFSPFLVAGIFEMHIQLVGV
jgi:hypothetical protein